MFKTLGCLMIRTSILYQCWTEKNLSNMTRYGNINQGKSSKLRLTVHCARKWDFGALGSKFTDIILLPPGNHICDTEQSTVPFQMPCITYFSKLGFLCRLEHFTEMWCPNSFCLIITCLNETEGGFRLWMKFRVDFASSYLRCWYLYMSKVHSILLQLEAICSIVAGL